jgi:hypothetical protein
MKKETKDALVGAAMAAYLILGVAVVIMAMLYIA